MRTAREERRLPVSTHAPARGATSRSEASPLHQGFQPTRPHGARRAAEVGRLTDVEVSTHAPARGATSTALSAAFSSSCFNPRARTGRDAMTAIAILHAGLFQPTRPHGARRQPWARLRACEMRFNPRARTGRDREFPCTQTALTSFQPTRPHGARRLKRMRYGILDGFNPRARTGRDAPVQPAAADQLPVSTHAPARGATKAGPAGLRAGQPVSTHAPARGATGTDRPHHSHKGQVSTHAPARGATVARQRVAAHRLHVSTHAPARGATGSSWAGLSLMMPFQPTRPHGARRTRSGQTLRSK